MSSYKIEKIMTDNPFVDEVVYWTKVLGLGCVVKDCNEANQCETKESLRNYDIYLMALENRLELKFLDKIPDEVYEAASIPLDYVRKYYKYIENIPPEVEAKILPFMKEYIINNYEEQNEYYRKLIGLRPIGDNNRILLKKYIPEESLNDGEEYLDDLSPERISGFAALGYFDKIREDYPDYEYLKYITYGIDIVFARTIENFELLYVPMIDNEVIRDKFIRKYKECRDYTMNNVYSEAFKYGSDYYDKFIIVFIVLQVMIDMLAEVQEHIAKRELFDRRCIKFIFEMYGVPYYEEIPIKYQINMMKSLNTLLKFKSCAKCMLDIASLFGFDNIKLFKYYLLRDRRVDDDGEYIFNYKKKVIVNECEPITITRTTVIYKEGTPISIPFPCKNFLELGNKMQVRLGNQIIPEDQYYVLGNLLYFFDYSILSGFNSIEFDFYQNLEHTDFDFGVDREIIIEDGRTELTEGVYNYKVPFPTDNFLATGGKVLVIYGSFLLEENMYRINMDTNIIALDKDIEIETGKILKYKFIYSSKFILRQSAVRVTATKKKQYDFIIPEPFEGYIEAGNQFFITIGGTYISQERYVVDDNTIRMANEEDFVDEGRDIEFHFFYNEFMPVEMITKSEFAKATEYYQTEFEIPFPMVNYLDRGFHVFIRLNGNFVPNTKYEIFKNKIVLDNSLALNKGVTIEFLFVYGKLETNTAKVIAVRADIAKQMDFVIPYPYEHYTERGNHFFISNKGCIIDEDRYCVRDGVLELYKVADAIDQGKELLFHFTYEEGNEFLVKVVEKYAVTLKDGQLIYPIDFPFYGYLQSGNQLLVTAGSLYIDPKGYEILGDKLVFKEDYIDLVKGRAVYFTFIYHSLYEKYNRFVSVEKETYDLGQVDVEGECVKIPVPFPFDNFFDLGGKLEVSINNKLVSLIDYEILDDYIYFDEFDKILAMGSNLQFSFIYSAKGYSEQWVEDDEKNYVLKFVKIPLLESHDQYIKNKDNWYNYDEMTRNDPTWDGDADHDDIKKKFLNTEFSYLRTKYMSVSAISSMTEIMFDNCYFLHMMFDDWKLEERLKLKVPDISNTQKLRFNDLLIYMFALGYEYYGFKDNIIAELPKVMYVKGFNFNPHMTELINYLNQHNLDLYELCGGKFENPKTQVPSYKQLVYIFENNKKIHDIVVHRMVNARDKREYDLFKTIYESYFITKYSKKFFRLPNAGIASTYTEFLEARSPVLYASLVSLQGTKDGTEKQLKIINIIESCVYAIGQCIDTDKFKNIFSTLPAQSANSILAYITKIINFFKSYKVKIYDQSIIYKFDDELQNTIRAIDSMKLISKLFKYEDVTINENLKISTHISGKDYAKFFDKIKIDINHIVNRTLEDMNYSIDDRIVYLRAFTSVLDHFNIDDRLKKFISRSIQYDVINTYDQIYKKTTLVPKEDMNVFDKMSMRIRHDESIPLKDKIVVEMLKYITAKLKLDDKALVRDMFNGIKAIITYHEKAFPDELVFRYAQLHYNQYMSPFDKILIDIVCREMMNFKEKVNIGESLTINGNNVK